MGVRTHARCACRTGLRLDGFVIHYDLCFHAGSSSLSPPPPSERFNNLCNLPAICSSLHNILSRMLYIYAYVLPEFHLDGICNSLHLILRIVNTIGCGTGICDSGQVCCGTGCAPAGSSCCPNQPGHYCTGPGNGAYAGICCEDNKCYPALSSSQQCITNRELFIQSNFLFFCVV